MATPSPIKLKCALREGDFAAIAAGAAGTIISDAGVSFKFT
jgi:hypothetical protein